MAVGFSIDFLWYQVGSAEFLHAFFSTICYHLENNRWGSKYPYLMKNLYQGALEWHDVKFAKKELADIQSRLSGLKPSQVIWDIDDLSKQPPWGNNISKEITDLSHYFVTSDGRDLISVIFDAFEAAEDEKERVEIISL